MARKYRHFVYDENQRYIYPTSDWGFKYLFGTENNKNLLLGVLRGLLPELNIESIEYLPRDITIPVGKMKDASFDVLCRIHNGGIAVIEMQNYTRKAFLDRSLVYSSAAVLAHYVNSSERNYHIGKTIFLAFVGDPVFHEVDRTPVRLSLCDIDEVSTVVRNDKLLQIFVELPKFAGSLEQIDENTPFVEKLAHVLMEMADCKGVPDNLSDPLLEDIFKAADRYRFSMEEQDNYMKAIIGEADYEYHMEGAREQGFDDGYDEGREEGYGEGHEQGLAEGRAEGREQGLEEGREQGLEEGREQGLEEGRAEGREEERISMARRMKTEGIDINVITRCTGLSLEDIKAI